MTRLRCHSRETIEQLLTWCEAASSTDPEAVLAVAFSYALRLNRQQVAASRFASVSEQLAIGVPEARRRGEFALAAELTIEIPAETWIWDALAQQATERRADCGTPVFATRLKTGTITPGRIDALIRTATEAATGFAIPGGQLVATGIYDAAQEGAGLSVFGLGFAPSYAARLLEPVAVPIPRGPLR